ncbi:amino acid ABC transporter substrate-binding protein [Stutzerimonas kirkiae]|uniref:amino acid ABC transporter substrate-binding protein n=1 Tax=Stutzerimonas kirkiae TaxID=2211392 RepID=UPI0010382D95|nr:amino acid ABC transporter substrate-binding protein [Stutzerimonas kirkiae]TBV09743.1 amino acid ABC transporter substrate-binding protein [Stutzerimonas kirkiae]TBV13527.1 amino acid ABC transporter substrate-binding protein [Stutzerimonas kirkiae]
MPGKEIGITWIWNRASRLWPSACIAAALLLASVAITAVNAAEDGETLERIARTASVTLGHRHNAPPLSYVADGQVMGYSVDICRHIVEGIRQELGLERIDVRYMPVTTATRFILIGNGSIDLECGATTNTVMRRKLAEFSYPHFVASNRFVSRRENALHNLADLAGRSVAAPSGSLGLEQLHALNRAGYLNISVILTRDYQEAFELVANGKAAALVADDILLAGLVAASDNPQAFEISSLTLENPEPYGILLPPGDLRFKAVVNRSMRDLFASGEIETLYRRWFQSPIPPNGQSLALPITSELRAMFASPGEYLD